MSAQAQLFLFAFALDLLGILIFRRYAAAFTPAGRSSIMAWTLLILAGLTEVIWLVALKKSNGFTDTWQGAVSITISWVSFFLLAYALKFIPIGTARPPCVWIWAENMAASPKTATRPRPQARTAPWDHPDTSVLGVSPWKTHAVSGFREMD